MEFKTDMEIDPMYLDANKLYEWAMSMTNKNRDLICYRATGVLGTELVDDVLYVRFQPDANSDKVVHIPWNQGGSDLYCFQFSDGGPRFPVSEDYIRQWYHSNDLKHYANNVIYGKTCAEVFAKRTQKKGSKSKSIRFPKETLPSTMSLIRDNTLHVFHIAKSFKVLIRRSDYMIYYVVPADDKHHYVADLTEMRSALEKIVERSEHVEQIIGAVANHKPNGDDLLVVYDQQHDMFVRDL